MALLETSFIIDFLQNRNAASQLFDDLEKKEPIIAVASPTITELWEGALRSEMPEKEKHIVNSFLSKLLVLPLDEHGAKQAAEVSVMLRKKGQSIQPIDAMIAGIAMTTGHILVTRDSDYTRIPGLRVLSY